MLGWDAIFRSAKAGSKHLKPAIGVLLLTAACVSSMRAQVSVTTWHNDIGRTGQNLNETILNLSDVNATQFGKLFSQAVDGYVYAQPLYLSNVTVNGQSHNVVYVATENDSVYAFDADSNGGSNASPLWFASMLSTAHGAATGAATVSSTYVGTDIQPQVGITGTPVIDPSSGTLYVVSATLEGSTFVQRLHALDVTSGAEKFGGPVVITASVPGTGNGSVNGTLTFDPEWENQRPALLLLNGIVYVGFASHGDNGPWHGWLFGYNAKTLAQTGVFCDSHNGLGGGMWMSGAGLAADVVDPLNHPYGRMFVATGNGDYTASSPYTNNMDYGDSILDLDLTNGVPTVADEFTPYNQQTLDYSDTDQASGGVMLLPTQSSGANPYLLTQVGKSGTLYLLNQNNLGGYNTAGDQVLEETADAVGVNGAWSTAAYWNDTVYYWGVNDTLKAFPLSSGQLGAASGTSLEHYNYPGATPSISANGNSQGIVWSLETDGYYAQYPAVLMAHNAANPAVTLYSSNTNIARDNPGPAVKFAVPTVANGKVYAGTETQLSVYGLLNGQQVAALPTIAPGSQNFSGSISVTIADTTANSTIYYTLDGTTPSSASTVYTGPITLTGTATVQAIASASGYLQSAVATASYVNVTQATPPVLTPGGGTYSAAVQVAMSDSTAGAAIYYTTDNSTPTKASNLYTAPITVSATETVNAIAIAPGLANSAVTSATYTLTTGQTGINFTTGFADTNGIVLLNGSTDLDDSRLQLTNGAQGEAGSAWFYQQVNVQSFTTEFSFQLSTPNGDGITFAIQGNSVSALGAPGGGLGYANIPSSMAVKFDLYSNAGEGSDSTGLYVNGAAPTVPAINLSNTGINLHSGDTMDVVLSYNGTTLTMTITDLVTAATYSTSWAIDIPLTVGGNTAWVGFTGGTGGSTSSQKILTWTYALGSSTPPVAAAPTFSPAGGSYSGPQSVTLSDTTSGTTIYYTTDGSTPTTASTEYTTPIAIGTTETLSAIAVKAGYTNSAVSTATYILGTALPAPTFSVASGIYSTAQTVSINGTPGSAIYYTTNGTTPTASSTAYSGPITVSTTETIEAIAVETGYINSPVASASYTLTSGGTVDIDYASGGFSSSRLSLVLGSAVTGGLLQLTNGQTNEGTAAWYATPVPITSFTSDFTFEQLNATADGMTFAIQNAGQSAVGQSGGGLGYQGIATSLAVKFDLFSNAGEGTDSTGIYTGGAAPTVPAIDLTPTGIVLRSGDVMHAHMTYDGTNLTMTLTDTVTNATATEVFPVNIPSLVGGNLAYVGFTGGTGGSTSTQNVLSWTYEDSPGPVAAIPTFSPVAGNYNSAQSVTISDATAGATIYYTTNGSTPTPSSTLYTGPIAVNSTETLTAIAVPSNGSASSPASAAYTITPPAPAPGFSLAPGSYSGAQVVSISDSVTGATIYYTTNGATPTASSTVYTGPITVASSETLSAIAVATGYSISPVASAAYSIAPIAATPVLSIPGGTYNSSQSLTISDATPGATVYYTTNGATPTASSPKYTGAIALSSSETVEAIAIASGYTNSAIASATYSLAALPPVMTPPAGSYAGTQTVAIASASSGVKIFYTTNGAKATASSTLYKGPISVSSSQTINAVAIQTGWTASADIAQTYSIASVPATPTFSPAPGNYTTAQTVAIADATSGATIYYTANGTPPTAASTPYTGPITVAATETLNAVAIVNSESSAVGIAAYTITETAATPSFSPAAGTYTATQSVTISDTTPGAAIYYTTNGSAPTKASTPYAGAISVSASETLQAIAIAPGYVNSAVATAAFTITPVATPVFSVAAGTYNTPQSVTLTDATAGATIYYTTNGTTPTTSSLKYASAIAVNYSETIQAIAVAPGYNNSPVASALYTLAAATPAMNPPAGSYSGTQTVAIASASPGVKIFYTTNGGMATTSSILYTGPIAVSSSETVHAIAAQTGWTSSPEIAQAYTIAPVNASYIDYPQGGVAASGLALNGGSSVTGGVLAITDGGTAEARSAWFSQPVPVQSFTTDFTFQIANPNADGMTFAIQSQGPNAVGSDGAGLGYQGIAKSVAVKFDLYNDAGEGSNSTGVYTGGKAPTQPSVNLNSIGVNLHSGNTIHAHLVYDGTILTMTLTDTVTNGSVVETFPVNIPALVGGNTAYVGFTGGTGSQSAIQKVLSWTYVH